MKRYKLLHLEKDQDLGEVITDNNFNKISIDLKVDLKDRYEKAFKRLINTLNDDGDFKITLEDLNVKNSSQLFWTALVQTLFLNMGILVSDKNV